MAPSFSSCYDVENEETTVNGGRHNESTRKVLTRHGESVETVIILMMEKGIIMEHDDRPWMVLYAPPAPPSAPAHHMPCCQLDGGQGSWQEHPL